jgi:taurine dioxygenase
MAGRYVERAVAEIRSRPLGFGRLIDNVDLRSLSDREFGFIRDEFAHSGLVFFHDQSLTPDQHLSFARRFGVIDVNRFFKPVEGHPEIAEVRKEPGQTVNIGGGWHTDHSYDVEPAMGSILYALEVPDHGGDTLFASMYDAWDALSAGLKRTLSEMSAVHSSRHIFGPGAAVYAGAGDRIGNPEAATQDAVHPVAITHPLSGRTALFVNPKFTTHFEGWTQEESRPLLDYLESHAVRPEFTVRFHWGAGSMAMWDNRATWHYALNDYHGQRRLMHRITVAGCALNPI